MKLHAILSIIILIIFSTPVFAFEPLSDDNGGILPSNRLLWIFDRILDPIQHRGDKLAIANERINEARSEVMKGDAESADRAREKLDKMPAQREMLHDQVKELEDRYNEKFDFNLDDIKNRVNIYLEANNLVINENLKVNIIGNRRISFSVITEDGKIKEIKKLDSEMSPDAIVTLSHGEVWASLRNDASFSALARKVTAQVGTEKGRKYISNIGGFRGSISNIVRERQ